MRIRDPRRVHALCPHPISGGMTPAPNSDLRVVDEPTSALDASVQGEILNLPLCIRR